GFPSPGGGLGQDLGPGPTAAPRLGNDTGDEDEDPTVAAAIMPEQLARILGTRPVTREPTEMVPYAEHAAGIHPRDPYYLARLGPWSRVVHRPASPHLDDGIAECGRRVEQRRSLFFCLASLPPSLPCPPFTGHGRPVVLDRRLVDFRTLAAEAGAGDIVVRYLGARGLARTATLALVEPNPTRFEATVVGPFLAGFRDASSGTEFLVHEGERPAVRAVLLHMYLEARTQWEAWSAQRAAAIGAITPLSPSASALPALPLPPVVVAGPPPKSFDAWGPLVKAYNDKLLDGKPSSFPTRRLAGADAVLARIYHGHTVSKAYTPFFLGEILAARTWICGDELNRLAVPQKEEVTADIMADTSSWLEAMATPPPRPEPKKPARPPPPPKAEPDQGADWTPPAQKWQRTGKGKKGQKGQKGGKKGNKGAGKGKERQRRQDEQPNRPEGRSIIVLSAFDGIGASHWLVAKAFGRPLLAVSWEVDRACKALVQKAMVWVEHRGDLTRDSGDVADLVMDADPDALPLIVWCA
ncbi:eIF3-S7, partial [Symbiodinium sp. CCMP2456]